MALGRSRPAGEIQDRFGGRPVTIRFSKQHQSARAVGEDGALLPAVTAYWFAWYSFFPYTEVFKAGYE